MRQSSAFATLSHLFSQLAAIPSELREEKSTDTATKPDGLQLVPSAPYVEKSPVAYAALLARQERRNEALLARLTSEGLLWAKKQPAVAQVTGSDAGAGQANALAALRLPPHDSASYLTHAASGQSFRLGKTQDVGSFNKIRDFVDAHGNTGKMRVVHLHAQRRPESARFVVRPTDVDALLAELRAVRAAQSPSVAAEVFAVASDAPSFAVKIFMPMPDLGRDAFYLMPYLSTFPQAEGVAAALRQVASDVLLRLVPLHQAGMVHCDIKLENIMVDAAGKVEVIDFGLARTFPNPAYGNRSGTLGFIPPELYDVRPGTMVDETFDTWSLGNVLLALAQPYAFDRLPNQQNIPDNFAEGCTQSDRWVADQPFAAALVEGWVQSRLFANPGPLAALVARPGRRKRRALTALDASYAAVHASDPSFAQLLFTQVYRVPHRLGAKSLLAALRALPPLTSSAQADERLARQALCFAYAAAEQDYQGRNAGRTAGPDLTALHALPVLFAPTTQGDVAKDLAATDLAAPMPVASSRGGHSPASEAPSTSAAA